MTAYVRVLGVSVGTRAYFEGPMAKQHRMAVLTAACLAGAPEAVIVQPYAGYSVGIALVVVVLGSVLTVWRRLRRIASEMESR